MDERKQEYLDTLKEKSQALIIMLEATERVIITGNGDDEQLMQEAEFISSLYEQRADVITRIQKMDETLAQLKDLEKDMALSKLCKPVTDKIKETAKAIVELDKKNIMASEKLTTFLKGGLKKVRDGRDVSSAYNISTPAASTGHYFDRTN